MNENALKHLPKADTTVEVETVIADCPPLRTVRALLRHTAPDNASG